MHTADCSQGIRVALLCSEPIQPPRLCEVLRLTFAGEVHAAEQCLRVGIASTARPISRLSSLTDMPTERNIF